MNTLQTKITTTYVELVENEAADTYELEFPTNSFYYSIILEHFTVIGLQRKVIFAGSFVTAFITFTSYIHPFEKLITYFNIEASLYNFLF